MELPQPGASQKNRPVTGSRQAFLARRTRRSLLAHSETSGCLPALQMRGRGVPASRRRIRQVSKRKNQQHSERSERGSRDEKEEIYLGDDRKDREAK